MQPGAPNRQLYKQQDNRKKNPSQCEVKTFLKIVVFGMNIQKDEITKNNKPVPKKTLR